MTGTFSPTHALLDGMAAAAQAAGALVRATPPPAPAATFEEFRRAFGAIQDPAEAVLRKRLGELCPGAGWAGEFGTVLPAGQQIWVADVVDGAVQYMQGLPQWCVSVTLVHDRRAVAAVLHHPVQGETYRAGTGLGALLNGRPFTPSAKTDLKIALVATSHPPFPATQPHAVAAAGRSLSAVAGAAGAVRNLGPTSWQVADVASGRLDAFWEFGVDDANLVGGALIAREAGVTVTDADGQAWQPGRGSFVAAPAPLHARLLAALQDQ